MSRKSYRQTAIVTPKIENVVPTAERELMKADTVALFTSPRLMGATVVIEKASPIVSPVQTETHISVALCNN
jgi:hypothetical protein